MLKFTAVRSAFILLLIISASLFNTQLKSPCLLSRQQVFVVVVVVVVVVFVVVFKMKVSLSSCLEHKHLL